MFERAYELWELYLQDGAELQVEIADDLLQAIQMRLNSASINRHMFNDTQAVVLKEHIMKVVAPEFIGSVEYETLLQQLMEELGDLAATDPGGVIDGVYAVPLEALLANPIGIQLFRQFLVTLKFEQMLVITTHLPLSPIYRSRSRS